MSAMEATADLTGENQRPDGLFKTLFIVILLGLLGSTAIALAGRAIQRADSGGLAIDLLPDEAALPFGFVRTGGVAVANDQRWARYTRPAGELLDEAGRPIPEVFLLGRYGAVLAVSRQFKAQDFVRGDDLSDRFDEWQEDPSEHAFDGFLEKGTTPVGPRLTLETDFLAFRSFDEEGSFQDTIRVNLTANREAGQLLVATWPSDVEGAEVEALLPILEQLELELEPESGSSGASKP